jgi:hypothetical protein
MRHAHFAWYELLTTDMVAARTLWKRSGMDRARCQDIEVCLQRFQRR